MVLPTYRVLFSQLTSLEILSQTGLGVCLQMILIPVHFTSKINHLSFIFIIIIIMFICCVCVYAPAQVCVHCDTHAEVREQSEKLVLSYHVSLGIKLRLWT